MKKIYYFVAAVFLCQISGAQIINIPDVKFKTRLLDGYSTKDQFDNPMQADANADGEISQAEALAVYKIDMPLGGQIIYSFTGINYFTNLTRFVSGGSGVTTVDLTSLVNLTELELYYGSLSSLNVTGLTQLTKLNVSDNNLSVLDVSSLAGLTELNCNRNNIGSLNLSAMTGLTSLSCDRNNLTALDIASNTALELLNCQENNLAALAVTGHPALVHLDCGYNQISALNVNGLSNLEDLYCHNNNLTSIDVSSLANLVNFSCDNNAIATLDVSGLTELYYLSCRNNQLADLTLTTTLTVLDCSQNHLTALNVAPLTNLEALACDHNQIAELDVAGLTGLYSFQCQDNVLTTLNVTPLVNLKYFGFGNQDLAVVDFSMLTQLQWLTFDGGQQTAMTLNFPSLNYVNVVDTNLETLDFSGSPNVHSLYLFNNANLNYVNAKNGGSVSLASAAFHPALNYFCANENDIQSIQTSLNNWLGTNAVQVNSYCSFTPGGAYNTVSGVAHFDYDGDGCGPTDPTCNFLKVAIADGSTTGVTFTQNPGVYSFAVQQPDITLTASVENPSYFDISPASAVLALPANNGTNHIQDFCLTPNGVHPDLEIVTLPLNQVFAGGVASYRISYKNKGNQILSGSVNFAFDDAVADYSGAYPVPDNQSFGNSSWNFTGLMPFESRQIVIDLDINSPLDIPPVNSGDGFNTTATALPSATDDSPSDNVFALSQTAVNSFDPNDKTCLEGNVVGPEMIGQYVHYMIRFENTGTANAQNIVVRDVIDTAKFDVASLVPIAGSHAFTTRILSGNTVDFIFENINLPFDDAGNDGYVAFKIKTKPTLQTGDTFSNTASIYFDYNFPIVTNTATTTIQLLGAPDFEFADVFTLYPNPVQNVLNILPKSGVEVKSVSIYNALGQLAQASIGSDTSVDVSQLASGQYFIKIRSDRGTATAKFVKR